MNITVFCDASYCPDTKVGGYGIWIKANDKSHRYGGRFKIKPDNSSHAEAMALVNAIWFTEKVFGDLTNHRLFIRIDCVGVIQVILNNKMPHGSHAAVALRAKNMLANVDFNLKHVKAHKKNREGARFAVNNTCDKIAYLHMASWRKEIQNKQ
jgi:ribonuclease HI